MLITGGNLATSSNHRRAFETREYLSVGEISYRENTEENGFVFIVFTRVYPVSLHAHPPESNPCPLKCCQPTISTAMDPIATNRLKENRSPDDSGLKSSHLFESSWRLQAFLRQ